MDRILLVTPPGRGGIRDFASTLAGALSVRLPEGASAEIVELVREHAGPVVGNKDLVLLNYSGYGFNRRGVPLWLVREMERWQAAGARVGIFFHELFAAPGPPWRSSYWLAPAQRYLARELARRCQFWLTNRESSGRWLRRAAPQEGRGAVLPTFSSIGELALAEPGPVGRRVVVFGSPPVREATYRLAEGRIFDWAEREGLVIHDVGAPLNKLASERGRRNVLIHGHLPATKVSELLRSSEFAVLAYSPKYLAKSSIFAAYAAHGVRTIVLSDAYEAADGLHPDQHYLTDFPAGSATVDVGSAAREWYQGHALAVHAQALLALINDQDVHVPSANAR